MWQEGARSRNVAVALGTLRPGVEEEGEPVRQPGRDALVGADTLVVSDGGDAGGVAQRETVTLGDDLAAVQGGGDVRGGAGRQALGRGEQDDAAIGLGEHAALRCGGSAGEDRGEIAAAEQTVVPNAERDFTDRCVVREEAPQRVEPEIARRSGRAAEDCATEAGRVDGEEDGCAHYTPSSASGRVVSEPASYRE